jgi:hypothetical protein
VQPLTLKILPLHDKKYDLDFHRRFSSAWDLSHMTFLISPPSLNGRLCLIFYSLSSLFFPSLTGQHPTNPKCTWTCTPNKDTGRSLPIKFHLPGFPKQAQDFISKASRNSTPEADGNECQARRLRASCEYIILVLVVVCGDVDTLALTAVGNFNSWRTANISRDHSPAGLAH